MQSPLDLSANAEAFLTALDGLKTQRWSLLWLKPSLTRLLQVKDSPRLRPVQSPPYDALEAFLQG